MKTTKATLGGFPLRAALPGGWTFTEGTTPSQMVMGLRPKDALALLAKNENPVDFVFSSGGKTMTVRGLYVLHEVPDDNPNVKSVLVSDWRWMWANRNIERDYNIRREVGLKRYINGLTDQTAVISPEIRYWEWSLRSGSVQGAFETWKVSDVLEDMFGDILDLDTKVRHKVSVLTGPSEKDMTDRTALENVSFHGDGGDAALNRMKSIVPGLGIKLDENSDVIVYRKDLSGPTTIADIGLGPISSASKSVFIKVNNRLMRPWRIRIRMEYEVELLAKAHEYAAGQTVAQDPQDLYLVNVAPVPDPHLLVGGKDVCEGTWTIFGYEGDGKGLLSAWNLVDDNIWTRLMIRQAMVPLGVDLFARLGLTGIENPYTSQVAHCTTANDHFRQTYQLSRFWMNRLKSMRPYRLSTINEQTGGRSPAICYSDYAIQPSLRGKLVRSINDQYVFMNVRGYPADGKLFPQTNKANPVQVAPCRVEIINADQGIFRLNWKVDPYGNQQNVVPSRITNVPNANLRGAGPISVDSVVEGFAQDQLPELNEEDHKAILFTASPASPNNNTRLYTIDITPAMIKEKWAGIDIGDCVGPEMDIFIGPNVVTCKVGWRDWAAQDIKRLFGYGVPKGAIPRPPNIEQLILNNAPTNSETGANIKDVALAFAAQMYVSLEDRIDGEQAATFNPDVTLEGWMESVQHVVTSEPGSKTLTMVKFEQRRPRMSISEFMDSSMRRAIFHLVQAPGVS